MGQDFYTFFYCAKSIKENKKKEVEDKVVNLLPT